MRMLRHQSVHTKIFEAYYNRFYAGVSQRVGPTTEEGSLGRELRRYVVAFAQLLDRDIVIKPGERAREMVGRDEDEILHTNVIDQRVR
jgi:hypothetical protein